MFAGAPCTRRYLLKRSQSQAASVNDVNANAFGVGQTAAVGHGQNNFVIVRSFAVILNDKAAAGSGRSQIRVNVTVVV